MNGTGLIHPNLKCMKLSKTILKWHRGSRSDFRLLLRRKKPNISGNSSSEFVRHFRVELYLLREPRSETLHLHIKMLPVYQFAYPSAR